MGYYEVVKSSKYWYLTTCMGLEGILLMKNTSLRRFTGIWLHLHDVLQWQNYRHGKKLMITVQFSCSVVSNSLWPQESQHTRRPCPSPTPGVHPNSCLSSHESRWCHPTIWSSVVPFFSCPQSLPASKSFPMSQLFARGAQSTGVSALASFLPKKSQGWSPSAWTGWISLQSKGLWRSSPTPQFKSINSLVLSFLHSPTISLFY